MLNGFGYALFGVPTRDLESTWRDPEDLENTAGENGQDPLLITTVQINNVYIDFISKNDFIIRKQIIKIYF